ncbi:hypothetical protein CAPTEDRAFT_191940 [Capitella teleta]|uniref:Uncharacterized protein n=1 Tax=Capitella teleta TaxID=283909 RepID=R7TNM9_CAPTE|nr:hypothetical protein CAPTEDRAFT_191940 [Capitella teleta]|eukprot:ELT95473.1 hypothetical protein CAPTEDRAFT_191940 [Capitella teleta]
MTRKCAVEKVDVGNSTKHDHTYATTPALLQHQLKTARQRIQHLEHEARNAKLREKRAKLTLESTLNELKQLKHINDEQLQQLKVYRDKEVLSREVVAYRAGQHLKKDMPVHLFQREQQEFTDQQKQFASTLYFYSRRAYLFVRDKFNLPHPTSIRSLVATCEVKIAIYVALMELLVSVLNFHNTSPITCPSGFWPATFRPGSNLWMSHIDARPGFTLQALQHLKEMQQQDEWKYSRCSLMLDAMSLRKNLVWDAKSHKMIGFVDYGTGAE